MIHPSIEAARDEYLNFYASTLQQYRDTVPNVVPELLIQLNGPQEWSEMHRLVRSDLTWKQDGQTRLAAVELNPPEPASPVVVSHSDLAVTINPFVWHWCQFLLSDVSPASETLNRWFHKWIDDAEHKAPGEAGFSRVIHQMTPVDALPDAFVFTVDFGSAPLAAFTELLGVFSQCGIKRVRIGSPDHE